MDLIMNQAQSEAFYSAMLAMNAVGGFAQATIGQENTIHMVQHGNGIDVWVAGGTNVESYADVSAYVAAYGLGD